MKGYSVRLPRLPEGPLTMFNDPPKEIITRQLTENGMRCWKAMAKGETAKRRREIEAIRVLLCRLRCNEEYADRYRPHMTDEDKVILTDEDRKAGAA